MISLEIELLILDCHNKIGSKSKQDAECSLKYFKLEHDSDVKDGKISQYS
jgi:hypothetical protein